jgi:hypothetical protein
MCDYSLHDVSSRPAKIADKLVTAELAESSTRGFAAVGELGTKLVIHDSPRLMAVCLLPGTELAFDDNVQYARAFSFFGKARVNYKVASFRQIDVDDPHVHHDALEFPDGQILKINQLLAGQTATVLQLPVSTDHDHAGKGFVARSCDLRLVLDRVSVKPGMASILTPSQGTIMLWEAVRRTAIELSTSFVQWFRRLRAQKQHPFMRDAESIGVSKGFFDPTLPKMRTQTLEEKAGLKAAA